MSCAGNDTDVVMIASEAILGLERTTAPGRRPIIEHPSDWDRAHRRLDALLDEWLAAE